MRVEVTLDKRNPLPDGALEALNTEFTRRVNRDFPDTPVQIRLAGGNNLSVMGGMKTEKDRIEEILQETWESADDWFDAGFPD